MNSKIFAVVLFIALIYAAISYHTPTSSTLTAPSAVEPAKAAVQPATERYAVGVECTTWLEDEESGNSDTVCVRNLGGHVQFTEMAVDSGHASDTVISEHDYLHMRALGLIHDEFKSCLSRAQGYGDALQRKMRVCEKASEAAEAKLQ